MTEDEARSLEMIGGHFYVTGHSRNEAAFQPRSVEVKSVRKGAWLELGPLSDDVQLYECLWCGAVVSRRRGVAVSGTTQHIAWHEALRSSRREAPPT